MTNMKQMKDEVHLICLISCLSFRTIYDCMTIITAAK